MQEKSNKKRNGRKPIKSDTKEVITIIHLKVKCLAYR
jgi:hypothetical protein